MSQKLSIGLIVLIAGFGLGLGAAPTHAKPLDDLVIRCDQKSGCPRRNVPYQGTYPDPTTLSECEDGPWQAVLSVEVGCLSPQQGSSITVACAILDAGMNLRVEYLDPPAIGSMWTFTECLTDPAQVYAAVTCTVSCSAPDCDAGIEEICIQYSCSDCEPE